MRCCNFPGAAVYDIVRAYWPSQHKGDGFRSVVAKVGSRRADCRIPRFRRNTPALSRLVSAFQRRARQAHGNCLSRRSVYLGRPLTQ